MQLKKEKVTYVYHCLYAENKNKQKCFEVRYPIY